MLTKSTIWNEKQNKPSLIVNDLVEQFGISRDVVYEILLRRGVFKWLACREDIIRLKEDIKAELRELYIRQARTPRRSSRWYEQKGRIKALEQVRQRIREICHSQRWRAPRRDREAQRWLKRWNKIMK